MKSKIQSAGTLTLHKLQASKFLLLLLVGLILLSLTVRPAFAAPGSFSLSGNAYCNTTPPVAPAVRLNWTASSGATSYAIYRNGSLYASGVTGTTFDNNANVTAGQTYTYYILAKNSTGSSLSNTITVTVPTNVCGTPPTPPGSFGLSGNAYCNTTPPVAPAVKLTWAASSGATSYDIYRNGALYASGVTGTTYDNNANVAAGQTYTYYILARNSTGNTQSNTITVTVPVNVCGTPPGSFSLSGNAYCNTTPPVAPAVKLTWSASSGATSYNIYRNGSLYASGVTGTTYDNNANVAAGQTYTYYVVARNSTGTTQSNSITITVPSDVCAAALIPAAPSNLIATAVSSSTASLAWTDNSNNETGFKIERKIGTGGTYSQIGTQGANLNFFNDSGLAASTQYCYRVRAYNSAGDSAYSNEACTTTPGAQAFSISGQVTSGGSGVPGVTVSLSGAASKSTTTDSNGNYTFTGLTNGSYTITPSKTGCTFSPTTRAATISGSNVTGQNFTATCSTGPGAFTLSASAYCNRTPPVAPAVKLIWTASSGVTSYDVYRNGTLYAPGVTGTSFDNNANVVAGQTYTYYVVAKNSTGSTQSNTISVAVPNNVCAVISEPLINEISPSSGLPGATIAIRGSGFSSTVGTVRFGSKSATVQAWSDSVIHATVPSLSAGTYNVTVITSSGKGSNGRPFSVLGPQVATPTFSPKDGDFNIAVTATISTATNGATIHFTTDGSDPILSSPVYTGLLTLIQTTTLKARAFKSNMVESAVASATFTKEVVPPDERIDPTLPTVVLTHGLQSSVDFLDAPDTLWTGLRNPDTGEIDLKKATALIISTTGARRVNIVRYVWAGAFQVELVPNRVEYYRAQRAAQSAGVDLARRLVGLLGSEYSQTIHFIGHSLGTVVNTYATNLFLKNMPNVSMAQFTALDRPHHVRNIPRPDLTTQNRCSRLKFQDISTTLLKKICNDKTFDAQFGYDSDFFAKLLQDIRPGLDLRIDNYYTTSGFSGVGDVANGPIYNRELIDPNDVGGMIFEDEDDNTGNFDNNHSGVQQWYRWTIDPNNPVFTTQNALVGLENFCVPVTNEFNNPNPLSFDSSLNPCQSGWYWSLNGPNPDAFPEVGPPVPLAGVPLSLGEIREHGCQVTGRIITCK